MTESSPAVTERNPHEKNTLMLLQDITCWFFTEARFREVNPFSRFEDEMLDNIESLEPDASPARVDELKRLILERTDQIFESDLSWGQNIYNRDNLRWVSFLAGYHLTMREHSADDSRHVARLESAIGRFGRIRRMPAWIVTLKGLLLLHRLFPMGFMIRRTSINGFLRHTYLPYTARSNWHGDQDKFYRLFFGAHSCQELSDTLVRVSDEWKRHLTSQAIR